MNKLTKASILFLTLFSLTGFAQDDEKVTEETTNQNVTNVEASKADEDDKGSLVLSIAGVVNAKETDVEKDEEDTEFNYGGAILIEANIRDNFGIETGVMLVNRQYDREIGNTRLVQEVKRLHIPIAARFWFGDVFSIAAGPFAEFQTGDVKTSLRRGGNEVASVKTQADDSTMYGADGAATLNLALNDKTGIFVEGRYSYFFDQDDDEDLNQVSGLAGVKIDI